MLWLLNIWKVKTRCASPATGKSISSKTMNDRDWHRCKVPRHVPISILNISDKNLNLKHLLPLQRSLDLKHLKHATRTFLLFFQIKTLYIYKNPYSVHLLKKIYLYQLWINKVNFNFILVYMYKKHKQVTDFFKQWILAKST